VDKQPRKRKAKRKNVRVEYAKCGMQDMQGVQDVGSTEWVEKSGGLSGDICLLLASTETASTSFAPHQYQIGNSSISMSWLCS